MYMHTCIHPYIHIHTHIYTYIYIYIDTVAPYCDDVAEWEDSTGYTCADYQYLAQVDGTNYCGSEDSAAACCFCGL